MFLHLAAAIVVAAAVPASTLEESSEAFMSGLYICREVQKNPKSVDTSLIAQTWRPSPDAPVDFERYGVRVFQSPDRSTCHVQAASPIDLKRLSDWMELTGMLDGRARRYAWNETRTRPLRGDLYRVWKWDSWRAAGGEDPGVLSHEINVLPGATQPRPGEKAVTATISYKKNR